MSNNDKPEPCVQCGKPIFRYREGAYGYCGECWSPKPRSERRRIEKAEYFAFEQMRRKRGEA